MSAQALLLKPAAGRARWRLIPQVDRDDRIVSFAQTAAGKIAILAFASALFYVRGVLHPSFMVFLAALSLLPRYRWTILAIAGSWFSPAVVNWAMVEALARRDGGSFGTAARLGAVAAALALGALVAVIIRRWPRGFVARNPRVTLLGLFGSALASALLAPQGGLSVALWALVASLSGFLWFLSYGLTEPPSDGGPSWRGSASFFSLWPAIGMSSTPFLKRPSFMRRIEAKTGEELAITQLKGLKLLAWNILLALIFAFYTMAVSALGIPQLTDAIATSSAGHPDP